MFNPSYTSIFLMFLAILCFNVHYIVDFNIIEELFLVTWGVIFFAAQLIVLSLPR